MIRLADVQSRTSLHVAGLMTGTSMDGLDVAICRIEPGDRLSFELLAFSTVPMPDDLRAVLDPGHLGDIGALAHANQKLGLYFADALEQVLAPLAIDLHLIGSHGQTVFHDHGVTTLQLGDPGPLAARFGCPVIHDFRMNDIALGGSGAPLVPYVDHRLLGGRGEGLLAVNIGGIANFTALPGDPSDLNGILGMDCGPGNMLMDGLASRWSGGSRAADIDGRLAAAGRVDDQLLDRMKQHPFFSTSPPRSTGREQFGAGFLDSMLAASGLRLDDDQAVRDLMATFAALTVWGIVDSYRRFVAKTLPVAQVVISGGGSRNPVLMSDLGEGFAPIPIETSDRLGLPVDAKEAIAFAVLASDRIDGRPTNLPSVTGAAERSLLGKITEC
ncbi:MAG: anhydro-N-acetylmuramic acid kinase [Geminicoccaceae bacterium]